MVHIKRCGSKVEYWLNMYCPLSVPSLVWKNKKFCEASISLCLISLHLSYPLFPLIWYTALSTNQVTVAMFFFSNFTSPKWAELLGNGEVGKVGRKDNIDLQDVFKESVCREVRQVVWLCFFFYINPPFTSLRNRTG